MAACGGNTTHDHHAKPQGNEALYQEVMAVHDEVMPKMDEIYKLKEALRKQMTNPAEQPEIQTTITNLDSASALMFTWMNQFNPPADSEGVEKAKAYLEEEKKKIEQVRDAMIQSIDEAKAVMQTSGGE